MARLPNLCFWKLPTEYKSRKDPRSLLLFLLQKRLVNRCHFQNRGRSAVRLTKGFTGTHLFILGSVLVNDKATSQRL
jgi:hypothetical protein